MKKTVLMSKEEALAVARSQKKDTSTASGKLYSMLQNAHPSVLEYFEDQLATAIQLGNAMGGYMGNLEVGTPEHTRFMKNLEDLASTLTPPSPGAPTRRSAVPPSPKPEEDPIQPAEEHATSEEETDG